MKSLAQLNPNENLKLMIYGPSGTGKTVFATSFPGPIYVLDFDGKVSSAARYWQEHDPNRLEAIKVDDFTPSGEPFSKFRAMIAKLESAAANKEKPFPFKTIVLDSFTTFSDALMRHIMSENKQIKRMEDHTPAMQDYLIFNNHFKPMVQRILSLPCNIVATGHIALDKDEVSGELVKRPLLSGKLPESIPILFEEVYRSFTKEVDEKTRFLAQTRPDGVHVTRTQIPGLPKIITLSYASLSKHTKGGKDAKGNVRDMRKGNPDKGQGNDPVPRMHDNNISTKE